jgi:geranylgeranyl pyrophosphate synthase
MTEVESRLAHDLLADVRERVDALLAGWADRLERDVGGRDGRAMGYALRAPGKRVRPALVVACYEAAGGIDPAIMSVAAAVEIAHTYSLVHDDLPCMDDDDLRRGRATTHRAFDVPTATRAGFLLVPAAALALVEAADALALGPDVLGTMAVELLQAAGIEGMVGGQWRDLEAEGRTLGIEELTEIHRGKTGSLIRAACTLGGFAARAEPPAAAALRAFGDDVGLAFQIADDVLDATASSETLGKTAGRDAALAKSTYVSVLGVAAARREAERLGRRALGHLAAAGLRSHPLEALAGYIVTRTS